jgi:predicted alpha/beta-fold hydrolase
LSCPLDLSELDSLNSFRLFDDRITAPLHGFQGVDDYYARSSSRGYLKYIRLPVLIIQANDDPFMRPDCVPSDAELSDTVTLELSNYGGHVGFVGHGASAADWNYWLDKRLTEYLSEFLC